MKSEEFKGYMECKFMRIKSFLDESVGDEETDRLRLRFVRNLKYCDLFARNEPECKEWLNYIGTVMIRTDFHERFKVKKVLGEGSFAKVYLATNNEDKELYAIKAFSKESLSKQTKGKSAIRNEIEILTTLDHPNLLRIKEVNESKNSLYLVCEYLNGGSLNDFLKNSEDFLTADEILNIMM